MKTKKFDSDSDFDGKLLRTNIKSYNHHKFLKILRIIIQ